MPLLAVAFALLIALLSGAPSAGAAAVSESEAVTLQRALDNGRRQVNLLGASVAVIDRGELVWTGVSGLAATGRPVAANTLFCLASVSKQYIAALTLRLVEDGRLKLTDKVGKFLGTRVRKSVRQVQIKDLLRHTSGLREYGQSASFERALENPRHRWTTNEVLRAIPDVSKARRGKHVYVNSNYILLGPIVAAASGMPITAAFNAMIRDRLGLRDTFLGRDDSLGARLAHGHEDGKDVWDSDVAPTDLWGPIWTDGGIEATAADTARFVDALYNGSFLRPETLTLMTRPGPDGYYGMGTERVPYYDEFLQGHTGSYGGFTTESHSIQARKLTIVVLTDDDPEGHDPSGDLWDDVEKAYSSLHRP